MAAYTPTVFVRNLPPGIDASELNKIGAGIQAAQAKADMLGPMDVTADSSDQTTTVQAQLTALGNVGGIVQLPYGTIGITKPLLKGQFSRLIGVNGRGQVTCLKLLSGFPTTTVASGVTTPASGSTTFSLALASIPAGMVLSTGTGVIFVEAGGTFIPVTFSGFSGSTLTGCLTNYPSLVISAGATVGCPAVIDLDPASGAAGAYGNTVEWLAVDCNAIPGAGAWFSNHAQEDSGPRHLFAVNVMGIGLCMDHCTAGQSTQNSGIESVTVRLASTAPNSAVPISVLTNVTHIRHIQDVTIAVQSLVNKVCPGIRVDGASLVIRDAHMEHVATPILIGQYKPAKVVVIENIETGAGTPNGIHRVSSQTFSVRGLHNQDTTAIQDDQLGNTLTDTWLDCYEDLQGKGALSSSPSVPSPWSVVAPYQRSGAWFWTPAPTITTGTFNAINKLQASPWDVYRALTLDAIAAEVTIAGPTGAVIRLGIYGDSSGVPGSLIVDAGTFAADGAAAGFAIAILRALTPARYWLASVLQGIASGGPTVRQVSGDVASVGQAATSTTPPSGSNNGLLGYAESGTTTSGALPSTFPASPNGLSVIPRVAVHVQ